MGITREILIRYKYLNFPVKNGAPKLLVRCVLDRNDIREFEIELA